MRDAELPLPNRARQQAAPDPSHDETRRIYVGIRQAQRRNHPIAAPFRRPQMDEQHLVFVMVDNARQFRPAPDQIALRELALEHRIL